MYNKISLKKLFRGRDIDLKDKAYRSALIVGLVLFGLGVLASYVSANSAEIRRQQNNASYDNNQAVNVAQYINSKLTSYEELVISGAALLKTTKITTQSDWKNIYNNLRIPERAPELLGFGFAENIPRANLNLHIEEVRQSGLPDYTITPSGDRNNYTSIRYLEPFNEINQKAFGYDMFSEPIRRTAMKTALETSEPAITAPVLAKQDEDRTDGRHPRSTLMYYPVYRENRGSDQQLSTLLGYSYLVFRADDFMKQNSVLWQDSINYMSLTDVTDGKEIPLYASGEIKSDKGKLVTREINALSRTWKISIQTSGSATNSILNPTGIFVFGLIISLGMGTLGFLLLARRATLLSQMHEREIQKTKDDLLALASHQLRTPATGVRQYLDMMINGFFGDLSEEQVAVTKKAFDANNRQLEIIDELLYVAKADAGQLKMDFDEVNIAAITRDVIDASKSSANKKSIVIHQTGKRQLKSVADKRYVTMIIENLVGNAFKYSYPKTKILVELLSGKSTAIVRITDRGVGIGDNDIPNLFHKFVRIENPLSRSEGGSGLGLFLAQKLAQAHGGKITVKSALGKGSTFTLRLPLRNAKQENVVQLTE